MSIHWIIYSQAGMFYVYVQRHSYHIETQPYVSQTCINSNYSH